MKCPKCNAVLPEGKLFCEKCGEEMTKIADKGMTGYICLHCGSSFVPQNEGDKGDSKCDPASDERG